MTPRSTAFRRLNALPSARLIEDVVRDVRHMGRGLRRSPGFAIAVVLTLALGIGGNTAIFSVVDQLLLRPLPYPDGEQLVTVYEAFGGRTSGERAATSSRRPTGSTGSARVERSRRLAAWRTVAVTLTGVGEPTRLNAQLVSSEFFPLLGVQPLLGRTVSEDDDRPNAPLVAVLSHQLWQRRFGGDPSVIGRVVQLNDRPAEIIGVMPAGFRFVYQDNDLWSAYRLDRNQPWRETSGRFMNVVAPARGRNDDGRGASRDDGNRPAAGGDVRVQQEHVGDAGAAARGADRPGADLAAGAVRRRRRCCCRSPASTSPTCSWRGRRRAAGRSPSAHRSAPDGWRSSGNCSWRACCSRWPEARSASRWRAGASMRCWRSRRRICCACRSCPSIGACCCTRSACRC